ncbi:Na/Pi cotransporter family protein [Metabacillus sp. RGM 3146]|uniref:Na/Pi cotransporter family protein n=1 Tax=Metabacillus sp. RGM 3146 TaxID=3401092 RepID=UPI003B9DB0C1
MGISIQELIFQFIGGLGIFLFGIKYMGDALQRAAGDRLRDSLDKFTSSPFYGVLTGMIFTILIQSSSGTIIIAIGLVSAGFLTLRQAIGIIMGANIGTTVTAFIIGIRVAEYSLVILAAGALLLFFFKSRKIHNAGQVIFGFGALFYGLELMGKGMEPLSSVKSFHDLALGMGSSPLLGVLAGTLSTVIVQSSSAAVGILQELYSQNLIDLKTSLPVLFGDNIGTTITAVLASIGASISARRAALAHVTFNLIGAVIFLLFLPLFSTFIESVQTNLSLNPRLTIAFAHGTYNVINTLLQLPFIGALAWFVTKCIPGDETIAAYKAKHLDPVFIEQSASIALGQAKEEILKMGKLAAAGMKETALYLKTNQQKHADTALQLEDAINNLDRKITDYLVLITSNVLTRGESEEHSILLDTVRDIERVGDHFENIIELIDYQLSNKVKLTEDAILDLESMFQIASEAFLDAMEALDDKDSGIASKVLQKEEIIDGMERSLRKKHIMRINEGSCSGQAGIVFVDIVSNLERIGDHSVNIAEAVLAYRI